MSDYPTIETGTYTWHPIIYTTTLLAQMSGCMKQELREIARSNVVHFPRDYSNCGVGSARKRRERFAPHLEAIKKMKKCGASWKQISVKTGIPKTTLALYWQDNPHLFGD